MTTVTVDKTGKVSLPKEVLEESHIKSGTELVVLIETGKIVIFDPRQTRQRMAAVDQRIQERLYQSLEAAPEAPFFGGLTLKEYLSLSEEEEKKLWDKLSNEAEQELRHVKELDAPAHFVSAGQRGGT
jgi:AbrB family looped-hinge helix DNA binding protein